MKRTPLFEQHKIMGARMAPFGGYEMPVQYSGINAEHAAVRENIGIFDVSHMGEFIIKGQDALPFLQDVTINDVSMLEPGQAQYSVMCLSDGGIVDDLLLYRYPEHYLMVVNAANIEKDFKWLQSNIKGNVILDNVSDTTGLIAVQGPKSRDMLSAVLGIDLSGMAYYHFIGSELFGKDVMISRTGYTGELGFEIYSDPDITRRLWEEIFTKGEAFKPVPVGPIEASLGWITKLAKGPFIGSRAIAHVKEDKPKRRLISFTIEGRAIPRPGYSIMADDQRIGEVTSGTQSPTLKQGIGLGYVAREHSKAGTIINVDIRGKLVEAMIIKPPFVKDTSLMD
jgi:aminomethyltransferase